MNAPLQQAGASALSAASGLLNELAMMMKRPAASFRSERPPPARLTNGSIPPKADISIPHFVEGNGSTWGAG